MRLLALALRRPHITSRRVLFDLLRVAHPDRSRYGCMIHLILVVAAADEFPTFSSHASLHAFVSKSGTQYLDLGASNGGSRNALERIVTSADPTGAASPGSSGPRVLGLDVADHKLRTCNAGGRVQCAKADLRQLFTDGAKPLVRGTQMKDILEHINTPVADASSVPAWRRRSLGTSHDLTFDTASHAAAAQLFRASCAASKHFCYMEGPGYDNERSLRALGYMAYWQAWNGHTCHFNSTSLVAAMAGASSRAARRPGASVVLLYQRITSTNDPNILRQPPNAADQNCSQANATSPALGCDRHNARTYQAMEAKLPRLRDAKEGPPVSLAALGIYKKTWGMRTFHSATKPLSAVAAKLLLTVSRKKDAKVVHCRMSDSSLTGAACFDALVTLAAAS